MRNNLRIMALTTLALFSLSPAGALPAVPDDDLLFYAPFDGSTTAAIAGGAPAATHAIEPRFEPGIRGQALVIGGNPKAKLSNADGTSARDKRPRNSVYAPEGNIDLQQGTLSFWIKPLDWRGTDDGFNVLFYTHAGQNYFQLYKFFTDDRLLLLIGEQERWTDVVLRLRDWQPGQWHHVAATWSPDEMRMYHNGYLVCRRRVRFPIEDAERVEPFSAGPGGDWSHAFSGHSLVDEFRIYRRPLNLAEIRSLYLADAAMVEHASGLIVLGERTPTQSGRIEEDSYAFDSTGLAAPGQLKVSPETSRVALSYDREALYLAVLTERPSKGSAAAPEAQRQDRVELYLSPAPGQMWAMAFAPDGMATGPGVEHDPIQPETVRIRNSLANDLWLIEAAIPFAALGLPAPPDGATWRFNLLRRYGESGEVVHWAPVAGSAANRAHFAALTFEPDAPAISIGYWTDREAGRLGQAVRVCDAASSATIQAEFISDTTEAYGIRSRSETLFDKGQATPYRSPAWQLGAGADFSLNEFRIVEHRDGASRSLFERKTISEREDPLRVLYLYTHASRQLRVSAYCRGKGAIRARFLRAAEAGSAGPAAVARAPKAGSAASSGPQEGTSGESRPHHDEAWRVEQPLPATARYFQAVFDLDFDRLKPDRYTVIIDYVAPDGSATEVWQQAYVVPGPDHPGFHAYVDPERDLVPAPWTPVKIERAGGRGSDVGDQVCHLAVHTWGRTYSFGQGILFDSLVTQGEEILVAPAVLRLDGERIAPVGPVVTEVDDATDMRAIVTRRANAGPFRVASRLVTHFDGYCEIDLELRPPDQGAVVQSLALDIPLRGDAARIVRDPQINDLTGSKAGAVGDYWHQGFRGGQGGAYFWVGGGRVGLNWLARDLESWHNRIPDKQVELIREGDMLTVRLNLIDAPLTLDAPRTYRLGFTLTPSRPLDRAILRRRELREFQMWCQPWRYFAVPEYDTASIDTIRDALARAEPGADEVFLYLGVGLTSPFSPEWPWFVEEWLGPKGEYGKWTGSFRDPVLRNRNTYSGAPISVDSFFNWMQHTRAVFFEKAKTPLIPEAHSYYFDTGPNVNDRYREQAINVYRMIRRTGPKARIYTHQGMQRVMPMQHFTDIICGGEGLGTRVVQDGNYFRVLTPEMFRGSYCPYLYGIKMVFIDMTVRVLKESHPQRALRFNLDDPEFRRPLLHSYGYCVVHDVDIHDSNQESRPLRQIIWATQDALGWDADVVFHPYWDNGAVQRLGENTGRIIASAYTKNGKMILAIVNDTDDDREVELALDLETLGMRAGVTGRDQWDPNRRYRLDATWRDTIPAREFRMVLWE